MVEVVAADLQAATNEIVNDLLVKTMNQGALIEAQARTIAELERELSEFHGKKRSEIEEVS